jgi:hypothetical protein
LIQIAPLAVARCTGSKAVDGEAWIKRKYRLHSDASLA